MRRARVARPWWSHRPKPQGYLNGSRGRALAEQGDAQAQYALGVLYTHGRGVPQDYTAAMSWYRKAAEQGDAQAQYNLGVSYRTGRGVAKDDAAAVLW